MHDAAIVPGNELAGLPPVLVGQVGMDGEDVQFLDQRASFVVRHADDVFRVIAEIDVAARFGMRADD